MQPVQVKICGLKDPYSVSAAVDSGADWLGFVFFDRSPRAVDAARAATLLRPVEGRARAVGLFVDPTDADIAGVLDILALDALQIYASGETAIALRDRFGVPVWHPIGIARRDDLPLQTELDALLVEARPPAGSDRPGGNGARFDWSILAGWTANRPWLLAGGLTPDNVSEAIAVSGARAVDVSSGVETAPGVKDPDLIRRFVQAAKRG